MCIIRAEAIQEKQRTEHPGISQSETHPSSGEVAGVCTSAEHLYNPAKVQEWFAKFHPGLCVGSWWCALWRPLALRLFADTWVAAMAHGLPKAGAISSRLCGGQLCKKRQRVFDSGNLQSLPLSPASTGRLQALPMWLPSPGTEGGTLCQMTS